MLKSLRNALIGGALLVLPLTITVWLLIWLVRTVGEPVTDTVFIPVIKNIDSDFLHTSLGKGAMNLTSCLIVVAIVAFIGIFSRFFLGSVMINLGERIISKIPLANSIYKTVKQIVETFSKQNKTVFEAAVLVEFPRKGLYSVGFVAGGARGEARAKTGADFINVFVPTTPNPTSGFLFMLPKDEVIYLKMSSAEALKLIVSFGVVAPEWTLEEAKNLTDKSGISFPNS